MLRRFGTALWGLDGGVDNTASAGSPKPKTERRTFFISVIMDILACDVARFETRVNKPFTRKLTQTQFDATASFDLNPGGVDQTLWWRSSMPGMM